MSNVELFKELENKYGEGNVHRECSYLASLVLFGSDISHWKPFMRKRLNPFKRTAIIHNISNIDEQSFPGSTIESENDLNKLKKFEDIEYRYLVTTLESGNLSDDEKVKAYENLLIIGSLS